MSTIVYALQLENSAGELVRAPLTPISQRSNLDILRRCGRNLCQTRGYRSWAIIEIKHGRARNKVIEAGDQHNTGEGDAA